MKKWQEVYNGGEWLLVYEVAPGLWQECFDDGMSKGKGFVFETNDYDGPWRDPVKSADAN
jgi:hypothetical protein